jgi:hypothetical protein
VFASFLLRRAKLYELFNDVLVASSMVKLYELFNDVLVAQVAGLGGLY